ncbi:hypothetical protein RvY_15637-2 [Ramazzottius varieornatus]|uniref:Tetratricopeptide repeat protein 5 OB fold domain-containing protein n=1 Tax=Ramazzottius varieornatus TaxID=947166 RepID=A0A1D1VVM4_RAMVA|nr:hypothetical protein RvY_15637-2 [Ramazzottius varieornatus]
MESATEKNLSSFCMSDGDEPELYSMLPPSGSRHRCFTLPSSPFGDGPEELKMDDACIKTATTKARRRRKKASNSLLQIDQENVAASLKSGLYRPSKEETMAFSQLQDLHNRAVKFRDYYFEHFPTDRASRRVRDISDIVTGTLDKMAPLGGIFSPRNLSWYFAYRALCLSIDAVRTKEAHEELQFAVRHLAHFPRLWIALGESFWEQGNIYTAISCFEKASMLDRTSVLPIINISCSLRLLLAGEKDITEKCRMLMKMVAMARYAVKQCPDLGDAWYNLGNALLVYFNVKTNRDLILEALVSFERAEKCKVLQGKAEFHYNYGISHLLCGNYQEALDMWKLADALEPDWSSPKKKTEELVKYLSFVSDLVSGKDRVSLERRIVLCRSIRSICYSFLTFRVSMVRNLVRVFQSVDVSTEGQAAR